jgi:hypothetical protein
MWQFLRQFFSRLPQAFPNRSTKNSHSAKSAGTAWNRLGLVRKTKEPMRPHTTRKTPCKPSTYKEFLFWGKKFAKSTTESGCVGCRFNTHAPFSTSDTTDLIGLVA